MKFDIKRLVAACSARLHPIAAKPQLTASRYPLAALSLFLGLLPASILLSGCSAEPPLVIVNQPMVPVRLEHEGCPGWWLSDALYEATLLKLNELTERNEQ